MPNGYGVSFGGEWNIQELDNGGGYWHNSTNVLKTMEFSKRVYFVVYKFYLNKAILKKTEFKKTIQIEKKTLS